MRFLAVDRVDQRHQYLEVALAVDEKRHEWRQAWLGELKKTRVIDSDFRDQIRNDRVYTCGKHFAPNINTLRYVSIFLHSCLCGLFTESPRPS